MIQMCSRMNLSKGSAKKKGMKIFKSWWWLSWQKKHENVFNFALISSRFAAQCIRLKTAFVPGRENGLFVKQMFLGNVLDQIVSWYQSASFSQFRWLVCLVPAHHLVGFFFGFHILQNGRNLQSNLMCVQNLWDDSGNRFLVLVRRWGLRGHAFKFVKLCLPL